MNSVRGFDRTPSPFDLPKRSKTVHLWFDLPYDEANGEQNSNESGQNDEADEKSNSDMKVQIPSLWNVDTFLCKSYGNKELDQK